MIQKRSVIKIALSTSVSLLLVLYLWHVSTQKIDNPIMPKASPQSAKPVPDFTDYERVSEKKKAFFDYLKPEIQQQNSHLIGLRHQLQVMERKLNRNESLDEGEREQIKLLAGEYRVEFQSEDSDNNVMLNTIVSLLHHVDIIPEDLVLVQAANESGWGTSRFAREGYNFFGLWCYKKGCGFVPSRRNAGAQHEVAKFNNLTASVYAYMRNLNRHQAYIQLREIRTQLRDNQLPITGQALAEGLTSYSERGEDYVEELQAMIRFNKEYFTQ